MFGPMKPGDVADARSPARCPPRPSFRLRRMVGSTQNGARKLITAISPTPGSRSARWAQSRNAAPAQPSATTSAQPRRERTRSQWRSELAPTISIAHARDSTAITPNSNPVCMLLDVHRVAHDRRTPEQVRVPRSRDEELGQCHEPDQRVSERAQRRESVRRRRSLAVAPQPLDRATSRCSVGSHAPPPARSVR